MSDTRQFWILRWPNGKYHGVDERYLCECDDPLDWRVRRYNSSEFATAAHDSQGHLFHQDMVAVGIKLTVEPWHEVVVPKRDRSSFEDEG